MLPPMAHLLPCPSCARHVRASETACPFCEAVLADTSPVSMSASAARLGRAAIFVAGTALVATAATGCGPKKNPNHQKPYGAPPADPLLV